MGFKIGRNSKKINYIRIDLDRGKDLYNMEFIRMARKKGELSPTLKVVKKIKGVYADQLKVYLLNIHWNVHKSLGDNND